MGVWPCHEACSNPTMTSKLGVWHCMGVWVYGCMGVWVFGGDHFESVWLYPPCYVSMWQYWGKTTHFARAGWVHMPHYESV